MFTYTRIKTKLTNTRSCHYCDGSDVCPVLQLVSMDSENDGLMKEYTKMMTDMIVLCATLALSLFFWVLSLTISTYYGEPPCLGNFLSRV